MQDNKKKDGDDKYTCIWIKCFLFLNFAIIIILFNFIKMDSISVDFQKSTAIVSMYVL